MKPHLFITIFICSCFLACTYNKEVSNTPLSPAVSQFFTDRVTVSNQPIEGTVFNGTISLPYAGGNGLLYSASTPISSTGVSGLSATLQADTLNNGDGFITFNLSGTPSSSGLANFSFNIFGMSGTFQISVLNKISVLPLVDSLFCDSLKYVDTPLSNISYSGILLLPYKNGNGVQFAQSNGIHSTGVLGLTAIIQSATLNNGNGRLNVVISGTPTSAGIANFALNFGGKTCNFNMNVNYKYTYSNSINIIFNQSCAIQGCHNTITQAAGINLSTYQSSITVASNKLLGTINGTSGFILMPYGGPKLPDSTIAKITYWVNNNKAL